MARVHFMDQMHQRTSRNYRQRLLDDDKAACATVAKQWGYDFWDGERRYGYGGHRYDGRWRPFARALIDHYGLKAGDRILDVGCGKGFLLYEFTQELPGVHVAGLDISAYAVEHAKEEVKPFLQVGNATHLPFADQSFDFVYSLITLHNLYCYDLERAILEIRRVGRGSRQLIAVESYRNEEEKANLLAWQLTCESFYTPEEWRWWYERCGYRGDHDFIFFT
ncbi:MAG: class I SAM-dependent methyltransferase [Magnetococcales bacterium]|nr:class I SAM-dependent methyltransferase [Magnetococcales bacterium]MBF0322712.1 class I SAM-dependent methyltransferase [Magnetococcales bacterium]